MANKIRIAIDGPAGSGKTTTARNVAAQLGYTYIDTGAMYRAVTLAWLNTKKELTNDIICDLMNLINISLVQKDGSQLTFLDGVDVSEQIRMPEVTKNVSPVSAILCVREKLVDTQRKMGDAGCVVLEGRDIGTVVFPNAELKIFLIASTRERARRRALELKSKGIDFSIDEIEQQIIDRDNYDSSRKNSPLLKAEDAIEIDTTGLTIEQQTEKIVTLAKGLIGN